MRRTRWKAKWAVGKPVPVEQVQAQMEVEKTVEKTVRMASRAGRQP
jgi:hypothetical protein